MNPIQRRLLVYKINRDSQEESEQAEVDFKTALFTSNPELFHKMYSVEEEEQFDIEEIIPESEEDVKKMMAQLKRDGVIK